MPPTVLIVDDHASFRSAARMLLEMEGWEVVGEAVDGEDGVRRARDLAPDLVLLDVQLPGMNGFEVAARLTSDAGGPSIVLTSSHDSADFGRLIASSGASGFIPKAELSGPRIAALLT